ILTEDIATTQPVLPSFQGGCRRCLFLPIPVQAIPLVAVYVDEPPRSVPCRDMSMTKRERRQILARRSRRVAINNLGATLRERGTEVIFCLHAQQAQLVQVDAMQGVKGWIVRSHDTFGDNHANVGQLRQT